MGVAGVEAALGVDVGPAGGDLEGRVVDLHEVQRAPGRLVDALGELGESRCVPLGKNPRFVRLTCRKRTTSDKLLFDHHQPLPQHYFVFDQTTKDAVFVL